MPDGSDDYDASRWTGGSGPPVEPMILTLGLALGGLAFLIIGIIGL